MNGIKSIILSEGEVNASIRTTGQKKGRAGPYMMGQDGQLYFVYSSLCEQNASPVLEDVLARHRYHLSMHLIIVCFCHGDFINRMCELEVTRLTDSCLNMLTP